MTELLAVELTALAARHIREAEAWWQVNRTAAPNAIRQELQRAFSLIASHQHVGGRVTNVRLPDVRRIYLPRIKYHVYFHVVEAPRRVQVIAFWHARRGDAPPI
jgi:hypothetical protein